MPMAWRIVKAMYAESAFDGEGSFQHGGRWNSPGVRVAYVSGTLSLAVLETLIRLEPPIVARFSAIRVEFDEGSVERISDDMLPDWGWNFPIQSSRLIGDTWARRKRSAILEIPSVLVPVESNYLINPLHADFAKVRIDEASDFSFDPRLFSRKMTG
jgi:RES domain-containing protein